jgi:hypothetical protein
MTLAHLAPPFSTSNDPKRRIESLSHRRAPRTHSLVPIGPGTHRTRRCQSDLPYLHPSLAQSAGEAFPAPEQRTAADLVQEFESGSAWLQADGGAHSKHRAGRNGFWAVG